MYTLVGTTGFWFRSQLNLAERKVGRAKPSQMMMQVQIIITQIRNIPFKKSFIFLLS